MKSFDGLRRDYFVSFMLCSIQGFTTQEGEKSLAGLDEDCLLEDTEPPRREPVSSRFIRCLNDLYVLVQFARTYLQSQLIAAADILQDVCQITQCIFIHLVFH